MRRNFKTAFLLVGITLVLGTVFQNCSDVKFATEQATTSNTPTDNPDGPTTQPPTTPSPPPGLTPLVDRAGVVTILLALGDQVGNDLVVAGASAQLISETVVRYASPVNNPKILVVRDANHHGESAYDPQYIAEVLLQRYSADFREEPSGGLTASDVVGYDVIWFNNPGHPMGSARSRDTLLAFVGGVILSGDDLSRGDGFDISDLTGLSHVDNGTQFSCDGKTLYIDNNEGGKYSVSIDPKKIPGVSNSNLNFSYGNDIDLSVASPTVEIIATARGDDPSCTDSRPVIVRYPK
jgi:hypothetical protein